MSEFCIDFDQVVILASLQMSSLVCVHSVWQLSDRFVPMEVWCVLETCSQAGLYQKT